MIFVVLSFLLRAFVAPALIVGANILSFGRLSVSLRSSSTTSSTSRAWIPATPLLGFVFLVALGVDYSIFLMSRAREESLRHGTRAGVRRSLAVTGGVITSAGLVLAATFAALGVLPLIFLAQIAFIVGFGVLIDTFIVRSLLGARTHRRRRSRLVVAVGGRLQGLSPSRTRTLPGHIRPVDNRPRVQAARHCGVMTSVQSGRHVERVVGAGTDDFDRVRSRVESLVRLGAASFIVPSRVTMARGDEVAVTEPPRDHDTLRAVLDARGALRAGECVWLGTAIAEALAVLHKAGLVHGALDSEAVVIDGGRVRLARLIDGAGDAQAADDIAALGRLLASAVREADSNRIHAWTEPMTHQDPLGRPTAAMVVHALASCAPPEEVLLPAVGVASALRRAATQNRQGNERGTSGRGPGDHGVGDDGTMRNGVGEHEAVAHVAAVPLRESRWWRRRLAVTRSLKRLGAVGVAACVVAGIGLGAAWVTHVGPWDGSHAVSADAPQGMLDGDSSAIATGEGVAAPAEGERAQAPDVAAKQLTAARFEALASGDGEALVALTAVGSPARADAEETAAACDDGLLRVDGLAGSVEDVATLGAAAHAAVAEGGTAVVRVRYRLEPHDVVANGKTTSYDAYEQTVDLTLEWVEGSGWLVRGATTVPAVVG